MSLLLAACCCKFKLPCNIDLVIVTDRSGSIGANMATVITAVKSFIDGFTLSATDTLIGLTSFADNGSLDSNLDDDATALKAIVDAYVSFGDTNMKEGLELAGDIIVGVSDRTDGTYPDVVVIISDGEPTLPTGVLATDKALAVTEADAIRAAGGTVFAVGVAASGDARAFLRDEIANSPAHYYDATGFADLEAALLAMIGCP